MPDLKITSVLDNSKIDESLAKTKAAFDDLYQYIKRKDFGEEFAKQLADINKQVDGTIKSIESKVSDLQAKIDDLTQKKNRAIANGDGKAAGSYQVMIDGLVKERTELLKNMAEYRKYSDEVKKAAEAADSFLDKQERHEAVMSKLGNAIKLGAVAGMKGLITATKAFLKIGLVAVVNAVATAFVSLTKYLKKTETGQMAIAKVTGYLSGLLTSLKTTAMQVGKALFNAFSTVKPAVDAVVNRVAALVAVINSLVKIGGAALTRDWEGVSKEFESLKDNMKAVWTGQMFTSDQARQIKAQAEYTKDLYAEREKLKNQAEEWSEEKSSLELEIAQAEAKKDFVKAKALKSQIYDKELGFLQQEYDIEKKLVDLQGEGKTTDDEAKLRDLRTRINELKADKVQADASDASKSESAADKRARIAAKELEEEEKRVQKEEQLQSELNAMLLANEETRLELMDEGTRKEIAQVKRSYESKAEEIRKQEEKWRRENREAGKTDLQNNGLTAEQNAAITAAAVLNQKQHDKAVNDIAEKNREEYIKEYGTFREKELLLKERFDKEMEATDDANRRMYLRKKFNEDMKSLRDSYSTTYSLIFTEADRLSDSLLAQAITATQKEIANAANDGKIQELESLYARLRKQLEVQTSREGKWGFSGMGEAYRELAKAQKAYEDAVNSGDKARVAKAESDLLLALSKIENKAEQVRSTFSEIGSILEGMGGTVGEIGSGISSLAAAAKSVMDTMANEGKLNKGASIATVFMSAIELGAMVASSIKANNDAQKEWNRTIAESEQRLRMLNLEALDYKQQNIFGVENPYKKAIDGAIQYGEAMARLQEQSAKLAEGRVQTGTRKGINWANVGKGAAIGASAGAVAGAGIFSGLSAAAGAAIGAGVGLITGLLSTKVVPVFEDLTDKYGTIVNEDFSLNPQLLADYDKLDEDTKKLVDNWQEIKDKAEEAEQQMRDTFTTLSGDIGNQLSDSLVNAFADGRLDSAIDSFHDKMTGTIEDIIEQMVFSNVFSDMFDDLQKDMESSFGAGGDNNIVDDLMRFEEAYREGLEEYGKQMEAAKEYMQSNGYDAWGGSQNVSASSKGFAAMSQDTASELNGRFTALQISNETIAQNALIQTGYLLTIKDLMAGSGSVLTDIRNMHAIEASYLEDIARFTKPIPGFAETLDKIQRNTAKL